MRRRVYRGRRSYTSPYKRRRIISLCITVILLLAIVITTAVLLNSPTRVRNIGKKLVSMPFDADNFLPFANGSVYATDDGNLYHINHEGKMVWGFKNLATSAKLASSNEYLSVYSGNKLQVISREGSLVLKKEFDGEILNTVSSSQLICVSVLAEDGSAPIYVLSNEGDQLGALNLLTGQRLVSFGISENGNELWILSIEESALPVYHVDIHRFDPDRKLIASLSVDSEAIYSVIMNKKGLFLTGTNSVRCYNNTNGLVSQELIYGRQLVAGDATAKKAVHVLSTAQKPYSKLTVLENGRVKSDFMLSPSVSEVVCANDRIYTFSGNKMYVYSSSGKLSATYSLPHPAQKVVSATDDNSVYLVFDNKVSLLRLP